MWDPLAVNYRTGTSCLHAYNFIKFTVVIESDEKIFVSELKQIHCVFVPWSVGYLMAQHWLFTLFRSVCTAGGTFLLLVSSWPANIITGSVWRGLVTQVTIVFTL